MSEIYKEAILEAKKLREAAEADAMNKIIENFSPHVKKMIGATISGKTLFEQDAAAGPAGPAGTSEDEDLTGVEFDEVDDTGVDPAGEDPMAAAPPPVDPSGAGTDQMTDPNMDQATEPAPIVAGDPTAVPDTAPIAPSGVDFTQLANSAKEAGANVHVTITADMPEADKAMDGSGDDFGDDFDGDFDLDADMGDSEEVSVEEDEAMAMESLRHELNEAVSVVDRAFYKTNLTTIMKESIKHRLFRIQEKIERLEELGVLTRKQATLAENRLEFLFIKLNEAEHNTYKQSKKINEEKNMKLKKMAARLFEGSEDVESLAKDSLSTGETGVATKDDASEHAADQSGMSPELDDFLREFSCDDLDVEEEPWDEADPVIDEDEQSKFVTENAADADTDANEDIALGAAGFGDTEEDPCVEYEVTGLSISEQRKLRKEAMRRKLRTLRENEGGDLDLDLDGDVGVGVDVDDDDASLRVNIDLPDEVEELLASLGAEDIEADVEIVDGQEVLGDSTDDLLGDIDDDEEIIIIDDESDDEDEDEDEDGLVSESRLRYLRARRAKLAALKESAIRRSAARARGRSTKRAELTERKRSAQAIALLREARIALKRGEAERRATRKSLNEANLYAAKLTHFNKFLVREGLSKKVLRQIVEHLDRATSIREANRIASRIEKKLNEATSRKLTGSSSRVTRSAGSSLNESVNRSNRKAGTLNENVGTVERWQTLAGIKNRK